MRLILVSIVFWILTRVLRHKPVYSAGYCVKCGINEGYHS